MMKKISFFIILIVGTCLFECVALANSVVFHEINSGCERTHSLQDISYQFRQRYYVQSDWDGKNVNRVDIKMKLKTTDPRCVAFRIYTGSDSSEIVEVCPSIELEWHSFEFSDPVTMVAGQEFYVESVSGWKNMSYAERDPGTDNSIDYEYGDRFQYWTSTEIAIRLYEFSAEENIEPVANAGNDRVITQSLVESILHGNSVKLNPCASIDVDGDYPLSYNWDFIQKPEGSSAVLSDYTSAEPSFIAKLPGEYIFNLTVTDADNNVSATDDVVIQVNEAPVPAPTSCFGESVVFHEANETNGSGSFGDRSRQYYSVPSEWNGKSVNKVSIKIRTRNTDHACGLFRIYTGSDSSELVELCIDNYLAMWHTIDFDHAVTMVSRQRFYVENVTGGKNFLFSDGNPSHPGEYAVEYGDGFSYNYLSGIAVKLHECTSNNKPVANAGVDQSVHFGDLVTLNGVASVDSDGDYPLTYNWQIIQKPNDSNAMLLNRNSVSPSFIVDVSGDYVIELIVVDSHGSMSNPDSVLISTYNTPPISDAGLDQGIIQTGTIVQLNGTQSYDLDGDSISYQWMFISQPEESLAELSDSVVVSPTFEADAYGVFELGLQVADSWSVSIISQVTISFDNIIPVAAAGLNQSVMQWEVINLDGNGSTDVNGDVLTYSWSVVSKPVDSQIVIDNPNIALTSFIGDVPGEFILSLVVNDGCVDSVPSNISIMVISYQSAITDMLQASIIAINDLDLTVLKNKKMANALTNKINAVLSDIELGEYQEAYDKLQNDILSKTDGCAENGAPDNNDWIKDCSSQGEVYPFIIDTILLLFQVI